MTVGFIGLGTMGAGMASNVARSAHDLVVYDLDADAVARVVDHGARSATSVGELVDQADVLFLSLPGPKQIEDVVYGADGIVEHIRPGVALFDLSTSSLGLVRRIAADFEARGACAMDAPVSGGPAGAAAGQLVLWVGGDRDVFDRHLDILSVIGDTPRHVGKVGAGTVTKLAHNLVGYMMMLSLAETFSMAVKAGLDPLDLSDAMRLGLVGRGSALDMLTKQFLPGVYEPAAFALNLAHKDVTLATALGRELGVPMRVAELTMAEMTEAVGRGFGAQDSRAFLKLQLERAGVEIAVPAERLRESAEKRG